MAEITHEEALAHFGVKGMRWGVRKDRPGGVSRKTDRAARKDAEEFTKAKMYYGEGAGTRRKLIKARVESRSKDPEYKKAFDSHVGNTDMGRRAEQARGQRRRKDTRNAVAKTARGAKNTILGNGAAVSMGGLLVGSALIYAHNTGVDRVVFNAAKTKFSDVKSNFDRAREVKSWLNDLGIRT